MQRILIVDDEPDICDILCEYLDNLGFHTTAVGTGREALDLLANPAERVDAALVDWSMPGIEGKDVIRRIHEQRPQCALFVITGFNPEAIPLSSIGGIISGVFCKPFSLRHVGQEIIRRLGREG